VELVMPDVNEAFRCTCGNERFRALKRFNKLNCELESDPVTAPMVIECADCGRRFEQTEDFGWLDAGVSRLLRIPAS
jgi:hypothetical protein